MYEATDVSRSIRRYLALLLDEPWTIRIERREVRDEERPVAVVEVGPEIVLSARDALTQGNIELLLPVTLSCYPPLPTDTEDGDAIREASLAAEQLKSLLTRWLIIGLNVKDEDGKQWSGPSRIPLWDYADVPIIGADRAGPEDPHDVLWVNSAASGTSRQSSYAATSVGVNAVQDAEDLRRWSVMVDFRVTMEMPGRERSEDEGYVADRIEGSFAPPPG